MAKAEPSHPQSVLVTRFSALGDVAMTIPVVYPVCRANPSVRFVLATTPWPATMMLDRPDNLIVVPVDVKTRYKGLWGMWRLVTALDREYHFDALADLHSVMRTWVIGTWMRLHGRRVSRIDKGRRDKRDLISGRRREQLTGTIERYRRVFEQLGLEAPVDAFTRLYDTTPLPHSAVVLDKTLGERRVAVSPFAAHAGKQYPLELMTQVVDELADIPGVYVYLMGGGKAEKAALRPIARRHDNVVSMAEVKHDFADEFALLATCDVMVSMDSANMHLASLMGVPVVSVWGATHPWCGFMGYHQSVRNAVQLSLDCRPCSVFGNRKCRYGDYHCLRDLPPERIVEHVKSLLGVGLQVEQ